MHTVNDIRKVFLDYFARNGHHVVDSSPLVPRNDPTLMFTNAGMVQFKNVFTGAEKRDYARATTSQKCVRAGGKHNDLENVGFTARHHTFFEMLGNFSFGDYFKDVAIEHAWKLITEEYGLPKDRLLVTVYAEDDDAFDLWKKIAGLPESKIIRIPTSDNFWAMGDTGPCGPCSEIFFDHGDHIPGGPPGSPDEDGDRFVEIWNLVFMQYEQIDKNTRVDLPRPSIDTGMGLERVAAVLQGTHDNYDIDLFRAIIEASAEATHTDPDGDFRISHRVISDHLRAATFLIADGVLPSNEGRGYVLRRIMRRAMRHAHLVGSQDPLMWKLVPTLIAKMGQAFPELTRAEALITETLKLEETRFKKTLERGLRLLDEATDGMGSGEVLDGETAFKLYDTFGFPVDLTQDALKTEGISVDLDGFNVAMERQRADARAAWSGSGEAATEKVWFGVRDKVGASEFLGYDTETAEGVVTALVVDGDHAKAASQGQEVAVIVNQTPFYGESGGQVGDTGRIQIGDKTLVEVTHTQKHLGDLVVHVGKVITGDIKVGDDVLLEVDHAWRQRIRSNHSVTHLLHAALREELGDHVSQKGSLVAQDRLRFDVSHQKAMTDAEIRAVEKKVNGRIRGNGAVETVLADPEDAVKMGAMALFGEKYGDEVRVVSMGSDLGTPHSVELCGGTHVRRTGDIGMFKIVSETAVAAGVRRIEAVTGSAAHSYLEERDQLLMAAADMLKVGPAAVPARVAALIEDRKKSERDMADLRRQMATGGSGNADGGIKEIGGIKFDGRVLQDIPARELKGLADDLKGKMGSGVVALVSVVDGKASLVVGVSDDLKDTINAVDLVRAGSAVVGGKGGGGRPDMAQAGGPDGSKVAEAMAAIEAALGA